jgi:MoaA/NifB/PqqE/SkfB family radical SAM enzyme
MGLPEANRALNAAEVRNGQTLLRSTPLQMNVELTGLCNVNPPCVFCSGKNVGYNYRPMDASYLDRYLGFLERCERVNEDSFGEPLGHPQLLEVARRFSSGGQRFSLVSNGLLLSRDKAEALAELGPALGLHISFNAATTKTFYWLTGKNFELLVGNVRMFVDVYRQRNGGASPDLTLTFIVMRVNRHEVPDFLRLAAKLGTHALLAPLHERPSRPLGRFGYDFVYEHEMLPFEDLKIIGAEAQQLAQELGLALLFQWEAGSDSAIRGFAEPGVDIPCLIPWRYLHVQQHSQNVYACPYHKRPIGNLAGESLEDIWNGDAARDLRSALADGRIPRFCWNNSASCPVIYRARHDGLREPVTADIIMGENDYCHLDVGWHPLEEIPERVRCTSRRAAFRVAVRDETTLCIRCQSFKPQLKDDPARGYVEVEGRAIGRIRLSRAGWHELRCPLPGEWRRTADDESGVLAASIVMENPWVPADTLSSSVYEPVIGMPRVVAGSCDTRELGLAVQRIWVE